MPCYIHRNKHIKWSFSNSTSSRGADVLVNTAMGESGLWVLADSSKEEESGLGESEEVKRREGGVEE